MKKVIQKYFAIGGERCRISFKVLFIFSVMIFLGQCSKSSGDSAAADTTATPPAATGAAKDITAFSILGQAGTIGASTIAVTVPFGTNVTALVATFTISGASINIASVNQISGTTANDFTAAKVYTVVGSDATTKNYTVTVTVAACAPVKPGGTSGCALTLSNIVTTIAGAPPGYTTIADTDGTGSAARFNSPANITSDGTNLYVADQGNHKIRKIVIATGVVTTLAGPAQGTTTSGDTDGTGNAARFNNPYGITTDGTNLFVAEVSNHKIRKIVIATAVVTTLAGPAQGSTAFGDADGTGNASRFSGPRGIATDGTNLFVADEGNNKVRKIIISTGVVTTLAGPAPGATTSGDTDATGNAARFSHPYGLTVDGANLYVVDAYNQKIRKIVIATGVVTTFVGPAQGSTTSGDTDATGNAARFYFPQDMTSDGTNLYIADTSNRKIRQVVIGTGVVTTLAGPASGATTLGDADATGNAARFNGPTGIFRSGLNLYVVESGNSKVRQIVISTAAVTSLVGPAQGAQNPSDTDATGTASRFNNPYGITTDGTNLFVAEQNNNKIRKIVIATGIVTTLAGPAPGNTTSGDADGTGNAARFNSPYGLTTDGTNLFVADKANHKIRKIVIATGVVTTLAGQAQGCFAACASGDTDATGNAARFFEPYGITTDGTNLYVSDRSNNKIRKIVISSGVVTTLAGPAQGSTIGGDTDATGNAARFSLPDGITTDSVNIYVVDSGSNKIRKIVIGTGVVTTLAGPAQGSSVSGDSDGTGNAARFQLPRGITMDGTNLYVVDWDMSKIRKIVIGTGVVTTIAGPTQGSGFLLGDTDATGNAARFFQPQGITTDGTSLYVTDWNKHKVRKIN